MKKFAREPEYQKEYQTAVKKYLDDGYAEKITQKRRIRPSKSMVLTSSRSIQEICRKEEATHCI